MYSSRLAYHNERSSYYGKKKSQEDLGLEAYHSNI